MRAAAAFHVSLLSTVTLTVVLLMKSEDQRVSTNGTHGDGAALGFRSGIAKGLISRLRLPTLQPKIKHQQVQIHLHHHNLIL